MLAEIEIEEDVFLPCYRHLLESDADINFLWGGRDSGKSHFIAQKLILDCLQNKYFRCILIKKTFESIKDAQWQTIKDICEEWGIDHLFDFKISPLEIVCFNGNKFISRGCDKPGKLKSISNPSHAWYEEGNQLTLDDFITISTTLRNNNVRVEQWFSFNPECEGNYEEFWLWKTYFSKKDYTFNSSVNVELADGNVHSIKYTSTHTTYLDNPYCSPQRKAALEQLLVIDPYYYDVYVKGIWGKKQVKRPYCQNFDRAKHVSEVAIFQPDKRVYISLDFNVDPFVCTLRHIWADNNGHHYHVFKEFVINDGDVYKMAEMIKGYLPLNALVNAYITGDATQRKRDINLKDNLDGWKILCKELNIAPNSPRLQVPKSNPSVKNNRFLVNAIHALHPDYKIHPSCKVLINELERTESDEEGNIIKAKRDNPDQRSDGLDGERYALTTWLPDFITNPVKYGIKQFK